MEVRRLNKDKNFEVILGEEISTNYGDVLVYYFFGVVDEAKKQDALIAIAHPFRTTLIHNHKFQLSLEKIKNKIDAIECFNARTLPGDNKKANNTANRLNIAKTAGSDAHFFFEIGTAYTIFENDLRTAIKKKKTKVNGTIKFGAFGGALSYLRKRMV